MKTTTPPKPLPTHIKVYQVGGVVRDRLLGIDSADIDWVVVGASPDDMINAGYIPVGKDFPVFLHPISKAEYALARTERKTRPGYHGFVFHATPEVTLEQDLARRDLSINAMAQDADAQVIDPCGGQADLKAKVLRHVGPAFVEDPVRVLRVARFAARFPDFSLHPETLKLMRDMVQAGEVDALVPERVWQELSKGLMQTQPSRMLQVLRDCGALQRILPELDALWGVPQRADYHPEVDTGVHMELVLDMTARLNAPLSVRFAALVHDLGKGNTPEHILPRHSGHEKRSAELIIPLCKRLAVPNDLRALALSVALEHGNIHRCLEFGAEALLRLLQRLDALRRPERLPLVLLSCECDARGRGGLSETSYPQAERLSQALAAAHSIDQTSLAQTAIEQGLKGPAIGTAIAKAQNQAIAQALSI